MLIRPLIVGGVWVLGIAVATLSAFHTVFRLFPMIGQMTPDVRGATLRYNRAWAAG